MEIQVVYVAQVKTASGVSRQTVDLDEGATVQSLLDRLIDTHGQPFGDLLLDNQGDLRKSILLFRGDEQIDSPAETPLADGEQITLMSPLAGG